MPRRTKKVKKGIVVGNREWTIEDCEAIVKALELHGSGNTKLLHKYLPQKTIGDVENFITHRRRLARARYYNLEGNPKTDLDKWIDTCSTSVGKRLDISGCVGKAFQLAAITEEHPPPETVNGVDYKLIYNYFGDLLQGRVARSLPPASASKVLHLLRRLADSMKRSNVIAEKTYLSKEVGRSVSSEDEMDTGTLQGSNIVTLDDIASAIRLNPSLNPLKIPEHLLKPKSAHPINRCAEDSCF